MITVNEAWVQLIAADKALTAVNKIKDKGHCRSSHCLGSL